MEEGVTDSEPESDLVPDHPPLAVQEVTLLEDQVRVEDWPAVMVEGDAERERVGPVASPPPPKIQS